MFAKRSIVLVNRARVSSALPFWIPSSTQWRIWPSRITCPALWRADLAALIWARISSQGTSSSIMRSMALICPAIFFSRRCSASESMPWIMLHILRSDNSPPRGSCSACSADRARWWRRCAAAPPYRERPGRECLTAGSRR